MKASIGTIRAVLSVLAYNTSPLTVDEICKRAEAVGWHLGWFDVADALGDLGRMGLAMAVLVENGIARDSVLIVRGSVDALVALAIRIDDCERYAEEANVKERLARQALGEVQRIVSNFLGGGT